MQILPTTTIGEVSKVRAPGVLAELGYHDNLSDAEWIQSHLYEIARSLAKALTQYFYLPFLEPQPPQTGYRGSDLGPPQHPRGPLHGRPHRRPVL